MRVPPSPVDPVHPEHSVHSVHPAPRRTCLPPLLAALAGAAPFTAPTPPAERVAAALRALRGWDYAGRGAVARIAWEQATPAARADAVPPMVRAPRAHFGLVIPGGYPVAEQIEEVFS